MSATYEGMGDKLSNTDPISNSVLISGLDFARDGANLLLPGHYPMACMNSYIHEYLHHMCFRTPVGNAVAYLYHRAFLRAFDVVTLGEKSPFDDYHVLEDVARVEATLYVMRPLAEGIALFGEFDAWPGESKSLSPTFRALSVAFAEMVPDWQAMNVQNLICNILARGRSRSSARRRKENLLMQGFSTKNGGYLPGYFLVKNLQVALFRHVNCPLLLDSEYYLNFLVHWFYGDFNLVHALLDEDKDMAPFTEHSVGERDSINAISIAFQRRFADLFKLTADQIVRHDEIICGEGVPWPKSQIGLDQAHATKIGDVLEQAINALIDFSVPSYSPEQRVARVLCHDNFVRRQYMCVGSFEERIEILANGRVQLSRHASDARFPIMSFGESEMQGPYVGRANVDVLQSGLSEKMFFTVYCDSDRVILNSFTDGFESERERLSRVNLSTSQCRIMKDIMRAMIDEALPAEGSAEVLRSHYREQFETSADLIYRNWCGAMMLQHGVESEIPSETGSLLEMCDRDSRFLRTIATLGCNGISFLTDADVAEACTSNSLTVDEFLGRAKSVEKRCGFRFLNRLGEFTILSI